MQLASILFKSYDKARAVRLAKQAVSTSPGNPEQRLNKLLEQAGATLLRTRKHQVLVLRNGKKVVLPKTPSDHRSSLNAIGDLRRAMREPVRT
jgi:hypothetical protein